MGFRYVKVEADFNVKEEDFTAVAIYSDMRTTAQFECGVEEVNQLFKNALWSMKGNFVDVPTDCPTREKSGYSGDCQAFVHTAMYLMDCYPVYAKWIAEQAATQESDGLVAQVAPSNKKGKSMTDGGIGWCDSIEIVPYKMMHRYQDETIIKDHYEVIKNWMNYEIKRAKKTRLCNKKLLPRNMRKYMIDSGWMWGEWLEPGQDSVAYMKNLVMHGDPEVGTAFLSYGCKLVSEMAEQLGYIEDAEYFKEYADKSREAYRMMYVKNGRVEEPKRQCRYVRPIAMGMLDEREKYTVAEQLAEKIKGNDNKLNTGFLSTHELSRALTKYGQNTTAYDLLLQKESPSWLYSVTKGATTILESWDGYGANGSVHESFNHYSYGAIVGWLFDCACGIVVNDGKITLQPYPDERLGFAKAAYDSPFGKIVSQWKYVDGKVQYHFEVPANMEADIIVNGETKHVVAGEYDL